jgi:transcriptional regulator with XRE-family HTH domain
MNELYRRIKQKREELGLSQEELAAKLGYKSRSSINKIEMGINDIPQSKIKAIANALNTTPAFLMGWDEERENDKIFYTKEHKELIEATAELSLEDLEYLLTLAKRMKKGQ